MKYKTQINDDDVTLVILIHHKFFKGESRLSATKESGTIKIGDIRVRVKNLGAGTALIKTLIKYAKDNHYNEITGWISSVDLNHIDKLKHFYGKFGFEISKSDDKDDPIRIYNLKLSI